MCLLVKIILSDHVVRQGSACDLLDQFVMIINHCSQFQLHFKYIISLWICKQNNAAMTLAWGSLCFGDLLCFGLGFFYPSPPGCVYIVFYENYNCFCVNIPLSCTVPGAWTVNMYKSHSHPPNICPWLCMERKNNSQVHKMTV